MLIDVVEEVAEGRARVEWATVQSIHKGKTLIIPVFRDSMKFDNVPAMTWDFKPVKSVKSYDGVRLPASARDLQKVADLTGSMLLTPKVIDLLWLQAGVRFDAIINTPIGKSSQRRIVAESDIHVVHGEIEAAILAAGGDPGGRTIVECVGKYWCLVNELLGNTYGENQACNYGWCALHASGPGVTAGVQCWQRCGFRHDDKHWDPSQTIRLMFQKAILIHEDGRREIVHLHDVAQSDELAPLISHEGKLHILRQASVPKPVDDIVIAKYLPTFDLAA
jgi:hypothetical protein